MWLSNLVNKDMIGRAGFRDFPIEPLASVLINFSLYKLLVNVGGKHIVSITVYADCLFIQFVWSAVFCVCDNTQVIH